MLESHCYSLPFQPKFAQLPWPMNAFLNWTSQTHQANSLITLLCKNYAFLKPPNEKLKGGPEIAPGFPQSYTRVAPKPGPKVTPNPLSICTQFLQFSSLKYWVWWTWILGYFKLEFYRLQQAVQTQKKNPVHQTWYFKLKNCKSQVWIYRRSLRL